MELYAWECSCCQVLPHDRVLLHDTVKIIDSDTTFNYTIIKNSNTAHQTRNNHRTCLWLFLSTRFTNEALLVSLH